MTEACPWIIDATEIGRMKDAYHAKARKLSWEEKVESIERMREASKLARAAIKRTYPDGKLPEGAVTPPDLTEKIT